MPTKLSKYFTLEQLTATSYKIANMPDSKALAYLRELAQVLDFVYDNIGAFKLISVYRSQALQDHIRKYGSPTEQKQAVAKSYHSTGQAADIQPTTMSVTAFMAKIAQSPSVMKKMGAFAIKSGNVHFDIDTTKRVGVALKATPSGEYVRLTPAEIKNLITQNPIKAGVGALVVFSAIAGLIYWFGFRKR